MKWGLEMVIELNETGDLLIHSLSPHAPQLLQQEDGGINPFRVSQKQVSRMKEFKVAKDQVAII